MSHSTRPATWHVPEPDEIAHWFIERWHDARRWFAVDTNRWLVVILALSLIGRLAILGLAPFGPEQARWLTAGRVLDSSSAELTQNGQELPIGPLTLLTSLSAAGTHSASPTLAILALLQVAALTVFALSLSRHLGHLAALVATALLGLGTLPLIDACNLTPTALTLTLSLLLFAALLAAIIDRNGWAWGISAIIAALAVTNDPRSFALALVWLGAVVFYYDRVRWGPLLLGGILALLIAYAGGLRTTLVDTFVAGLSAPAQESYGDRLLGTITQVADYVSGRNLAELSAPAEPGIWATGALWDRLRSLLALFLWVALPWSAVQAVQSWSRWQDRQQGPERTLLALWLWLPLLFAPRIAPHASGLTARMVAPAAAATIGALATAIDARVRRPDLAQWRWAWLAVLVAGGAALGANLFSAQALPQFALTHDSRAGYGTPYRLWQQIDELVAEGTEETDADQLWVYGPEAGPDAETAAAYLDQAVFVMPSGQLLPAGRPGLYLRWTSDAESDDLLERLGSRVLGTVDWPDGSQAQVFSLRERTAEELLEMAPDRTAIHYDAGLLLIGYDWPADATVGQEALLVTYWTMTNISSQDQQSGHLVSLAVKNRSGEQIAWNGELALDGAYWQEGLLLRQESLLEIPDTWAPGPAVLVGEVRRTASQEAVPILDISARPGHPTGELGPVWVN